MSVVKTQEKSHVFLSLLAIYVNVSVLCVTIWHHGNGELLCEQSTKRPSYMACRLIPNVVITAQLLDLHQALIIDLRCYCNCI